MDAKLSHQVTCRRALRAGPWMVGTLGLLLGVGVLVLACSDNKGPVGPTYPAAQTGRTALALFPTKVTIADAADFGGAGPATCHEAIQFLATGGEAPYRFTTAFSAGAPFGRSSIDASGRYTAILDDGASFNPDTVLVIDSIGAQATATVTITCGTAAATAPPA
jgi:hypothetical protein